MTGKVNEDARRIIEDDPYAAHLGAEVTELKPGEAKVRLKLAQHHRNFMGLVHGGVMFSLADVAFGAAANSFGTKAMALSVHIDFLAPPAADDVLTAEVRLVSRAGRMGFYRMEVRDSEDRLIAQCGGWAYHTGRPLGEEGSEGSEEG